MADPTRAYFWPAVNKRLTRHRPGYFPTRTEVIFFDLKGKKLKNLTFLGADLTHHYLWVKKSYQVGSKKPSKTSYLLQVNNIFHKISSGQVKKYLGLRRVALLFTTGQKYAQVGSGPISMVKTACQSPVWIGQKRYPTLGVCHLYITL